MCQVLCLLRCSRYCCFALVETTHPGTRTRGKHLGDTKTHLVEPHQVTGPQRRVHLRINRRVEHHIRIRVPEVCPSVEMAHRCMTKINLVSARYGFVFVSNTHTYNVCCTHRGTHAEIPEQHVNKTRTPVIGAAYEIKLVINNGTVTDES